MTRPMQTRKERFDAFIADLPRFSLPTALSVLGATWGALILYDLIIGDYERSTAFDFDFLRAPWRADHLRRVIDATLGEHASVGAPPTWVLSNHDVAREVSRFARVDKHHNQHQLRDLAGAVDLALGARRARAALLLMAALPGSFYVYQGEELGLPEVEDLPEDSLQDPTWLRSGRTDRGRDGCRVPVPWSGTTSPFGFGPPGTTPWLPQPEWFAAYTAEVQDGAPGSALTLYREVLRLRRELTALGDGDLEWLSAGEHVLAFRRQPGFVCVVNLGGNVVGLPAHTAVLASSAPLRAGLLPGDAAAWLSV